MAGFLQEKTFQNFLMKLLLTVQEIKKCYIPRPRAAQVHREAQVHRALVKLIIE
jgi:hypothetical protein